MVIGAEQVDAQVEAALALVDVVGGVGREVGVFAIGLDEHPVLVVVEVGRAQPDCAVHLIDMAVLAQLLEPVLDRIRLVQRALGVPDVEHGAEQGEHMLLLGELPRVGRFAEGRHLLIGRQGEQIRLLRNDFYCEVEDVAALVAVLRDRLTMRSRHDRGTELVHLDAPVVDVELLGDRGSCRREHPGEGIAHCSPTGMAQVEGAGRVRGDELDVHGPAGEGIAVPEHLASLDDAPGHLALRGSVEGDVDEAGAGHLGRCDAIGLGELDGQLLGDHPRGHAGLLREGQRDVRRIVAVLAGLRSLDVNLGGDVDREGSGRDKAGKRITHAGGEGIRSHRASVSALLPRPGIQLSRGRPPATSGRTDRGLVGDPSSGSPTASHAQSPDVASDSTRMARACIVQPSIEGL